MDRYWHRLRLTAFFVDAIAVLLAYTLAAGVLLNFGELVPGQVGPVYPALAVGVAFLTIALGWQFGIYRRWALLGGHRLYPLLLTVATYGVVVVIMLSFFLTPSPFVSRAWLVGSWAGAVAALSTGRLLLRQLALRWRRRGYLIRRVLVAGANQHGMAVAQQLNNPPMHGTQVVGFLDDYQRPGTDVVAGLKVVGHPARVLEHAAALGADEVVIISNGLSWESQQILAELVTRPDSRLEARISATFYDLLTTSAELSHVAYIPMLTLDRTRLSRVNGTLKGVVDRAVSGVLLLAFTPAMLYWRVKAWALGITMLQRDPVLGLGGRPFALLALHPRLTRSPVVARLPSLWNVFRQDLSLIGPRPIEESELNSHERWLANLFAMRPGLTGLWRLRGAELPLEQSVASDLYYVRNYSLTMDGQILLHTLRHLARRGLGFEDQLARWSRLRRSAQVMEPRSAKIPRSESTDPSSERGAEAAPRKEILR